jgi:hypothetical protein
VENVHCSLNKHSHSHLEIHLEIHLETSGSMNTRIAYSSHRSHLLVSQLVRRTDNVVVALVVAFAVLMLGTVAQAQVQTVTTTGPEQDCLGALPLADTAFVQPNVYRGVGRVNEAGSSCLGMERNSVWYKFTARANGRLGFVIEPNNPQDDFDWAVYRMPQQASCADIASGAVMAVSCNFSSTPGRTGANGGSNETRQESAGTPFNATIAVSAGEVYYLLVTNFNATSGYRLSFAPSSSGVIPPSGITTASPGTRSPQPRLAAVTFDGNACSLTSLNAVFSEYVRCSSVRASSFVVVGQDGVFPVLDVASQRCGRSPNNYDTAYTLLLAQPIINSGTYTLTVVGGVSTLDNVTVTGSTTFTLSLQNIRPRVAGSTVLCSGGAVTLDAENGFTTYQWATTTANVTRETILSTSRRLIATRAGTYYLTVSDKDGCYGSTSVTVTLRTDALTPVLWGARYFCEGGRARLGVMNAERYTSIRWSNGDTTASTAFNQPGQHSVTVTDVGGCSGMAQFTVERGNQISTTISGTPQFCEGGSTTLSVEPFLERYQWLLNDQPVSGATSHQLTIRQPGAYKVQLGNNGCTAESGTLVVRATPLPPRPVIVQTGNILNAPPAQSYQWFAQTRTASGMTNTALPNATRREFIPPTSGAYFVIIRDQNRCEAASDVVNFQRAEGQATLQAPVMTGEQGRTVEIPITLRNPQNLAATGVTGFEVVLRFSGQILVPDDVTLRDSVVGGERFIRLRLPAQPQNLQTQNTTLQNDAVLGRFTFRVLVGSTSSTVLALQNAVALPLGIGVNVTTANGSFGLTGRIILSTSGTVVVAANPNPANAFTEISYMIPEDDTVTVILADMNGNVLKTVMDGVMQSAGRHSVPVAISDIHSGAYFVIVRTSKETATARLTVVR